MASGNTLLVFGALAAKKPATAYPQFATRNQHPVQKFDASTEETCFFEGILPRNYAGGGITVYLHWSAASATSGAVVWGVSIERIGEGSQDADSDGFASEINASAATAPGTTGFVDIQSVAFTSGAQMDSLAVGEWFRIRIARKVADGGDTMTGDAELWGIEIKET
jgi:hypothetical protein